MRIAFALAAVGQGTHEVPQLAMLASATQAPEQM